jgi:hypothetical protein
VLPVPQCPGEGTALGSIADSAMESTSTLSIQGQRRLVRKILFLFALGVPLSDVG